MRKIIIIACGLLIAGCATKPMHPVAKILQDFNTGCYANIEKQPETMMVREEIIPNKQLSPTEIYDFLNSTAKVSQSQKRALGIYIMMDMDCDKALANALTGTPFQKPRIEFNNQLHPLYKQLLDGRISIGEFNTQLKEAFNTFAAGQATAVKLDQADQAANALYAQQLFYPYNSGNIYIFQGR